MRKSTEIKKDLQENKELLKAEGLMADEKTFIESEIKDLELELEKALENEKKNKLNVKKPSVKKTIAKKTKVPATVKKTPAAKKFIMFEGKKIFEDDANYCEKLVQAWEKRKEERKKAAGKRKTTPVTQRVAANVAQAITKGVKSMTTDDIKKDPKKAISDIEKLEKAGKDFLEAFRTVLGEKITQKEIKEEFDGIEKIILEIKKKYINSNSGKKFADGGNIDVRDEGNLAKTEDGRVGKITKVHGLYYTLKFSDGKLPIKKEYHQSKIIFTDSKGF